MRAIVHSALQLARMLTKESGTSRPGLSDIICLEHCPNEHVANCARCSNTRKYQSGFREEKGIVYTGCLAGLSTARATAAVTSGAVGASGTGPFSSPPAGGAASSTGVSVPYAPPASPIGASQPDGASLDRAEIHMLLASLSDLRGPQIYVCGNQ